MLGLSELKNLNYDSTYKQIKRKLYVRYNIRNRNSSVSVVTTIEAKGSGLPIPIGLIEVSLLHNPHLDSGSHPVSHSLETGVLSSGVKRPGRGTHNSPLSSAEVTKEWSYNSNPSPTSVFSWLRDGKICLFNFQTMIKSKIKSRTIHSFIRRVY